MKRTDLIYESGILNDKSCGNIVHSGEKYGTFFSDINVDADTAKKHDLKIGRYISVFTESGDPVRCISALLGEMLPEGDVLVAGLGNENICSDSLGVKALSFIPATAHLSVCSEFSELGMRKVYVLEAGVTGKTGIESSERISCIAGHVGACAVVAIDSLACTKPDRLCSTVQLTDTGISPGSGVGNDRKALNSVTVGVPVIAAGVPTVIDLSSITGADENNGLMVTPRNIDMLADKLASIVGRAVSTALNPSLSEKELNALILK